MRRSLAISKTLSIRAMLAGNSRVGSAGLKASLLRCRRMLSTADAAPLPPRETMEYDALVVGGGPAGAMRHCETCICSADLSEMTC